MSLAVCLPGVHFGRLILLGNGVFIVPWISACGYSRRCLCLVRLQEGWLGESSYLLFHAVWGAFVLVGVSPALPGHTVGSFCFPRGWWHWHPRGCDHAGDCCGSQYLECSQEFDVVTSVKGTRAVVVNAVRGAHVRNAIFVWEGWCWCMCSRMNP